MMENGRIIYQTDRANTSPLHSNIVETGWKGGSMVLDELIIQMEIYTKVNFAKGKKPAKGYINLPMVMSTKESFMKTKLMALAFLHLLTGIDMKASF